MANFRVTTALRNARLDGLAAAIDLGATGGLIKIYSGTQPANADAALSGNTLLGTLTFATASAVGAATGGVLTFATITQGTAVATNTATWARITDSTGAQVFDCDVAAPSGGTINLNTTNIVTGGPIQISTFTITDPAT